MADEATYDTGVEDSNADLISGVESDKDDADLVAAPEGDGKGKDDDTGTDSEDAEGDKDKEGGAPEQYEDFTFPEGMEIDTSALEAFVPVAKELNLTQEQAQKIVDLQIKRVQAESEAATKEWTDRFTQWKADAKADAEVGGDKFDESVGFANKAVKQFMTPEGYAALAGAGLQNHPEMLRFFARVGRTISEDKIIGGNPGGGAPRDAADILYGSTGDKNTM
jgi:hypothetical protein